MRMLFTPVAPTAKRTGCKERSELSRAALCTSIDNRLRPGRRSPRKELRSISFLVGSPEAVAALLGPAPGANLRLATSVPFK